MKYQNIFVAVLVGCFAVFSGVVWAQAEIPNPFSPCRDVGCILVRIARFLLIIATPILTIMVLWAGFLYMTAGGDPKKVQSAHDTLKWALIGFAIILINMGFALVIREILGGGGNRGGGGGGPPGDFMF